MLTGLQLLALLLPLQRACARCARSLRDVRVRACVPHLGVSVRARGRRAQVKGVGTVKYLVDVTTCSSASADDEAGDEAGEARRVGGGGIDGGRTGAQVLASHVLSRRPTPTASSVPLRAHAATGAPGQLRTTCA